jgi:hypothetical protein
LAEEIMSWSPKDPEIAAMLSADGKRRYEYFIHRVADTQKVWSLHSDGWAALSDNEGKKLFPLWPHEKYAERFKSEGLDGYEPRAIDTDLFVEEWLPKMKEAGVAPAVFPIAAGESVIVSCDDLQANLRDELAKY